VPTPPDRVVAQLSTLADETVDGAEVGEPRGCGMRHGRSWVRDSVEKYLSIHSPRFAARADSLI
jgi:hypothetical protein